LRTRALQADAHRDAQFLGEFRDGGGAGIEVVTSSHTPEQYLEYAILAREFGFRIARVGFSRSG
jgi:predicted metal-dependent phosphoesterase TrpH